MSKEHWSWAFPGHRPWAAFAFGQTGRFFEAGEVRLAILSLLSDGPKHGYQLMKEMAEPSGGLYKASAGSVYPNLQQLEDKGLPHHRGRASRTGQSSGSRAPHLGARRALGGLGPVLRPDRVRTVLERVCQELEDL